MRQLGPCAASVSAPGGGSGRGWCARGSQWTSSAARGAEEGGGCWRCSPRAASCGAFCATCTCPSCPHPRHLPGGQRSRRCGSDDARLRDALSGTAQGERSPAQGRGVPGSRRAGLLRALLHRPMRVARPSWTTTYPGPRPQQGSHAAYAPLRGGPTLLLEVLLDGSSARADFPDGLTQLRLGAAKLPAPVPETDLRRLALRLRSTAVFGARPGSHSRGGSDCGALRARPPVGLAVPHPILRD